MNTSATALPRSTVKIYSNPFPSLTGHGFFLLKRLFASLVSLILLALSLIGLWFATLHPLAFLIESVLLLSIGLLGSYMVAMSVLHPHRSRPTRVPTDFGIEQWEDVRLRAADGVELGAWFVPPAPQSAGATIVFVHGLGANRSELLNEAAMLVAHGFGALLIDLRNHGQSRGTLTTLGYLETEDVVGAVEYLLTRPEVNSERIGLFGHSMGGAAVLRAAARLPQVRAVIAESAYASLRDNLAQGLIAKTCLPPFPFVPLLLWLGERITRLHIDWIRPIDDVTHLVSCAVLFIHGKKDCTIKAANAEELYAAARWPKGLYLIDEGTHTELAVAEPVKFEKRITGFLEWSLRGIDRRRAPRPKVDESNTRSARNSRPMRVFA